MGDAHRLGADRKTAHPEKPARAAHMSPVTHELKQATAAAAAEEVVQIDQEEKLEKEEVGSLERCPRRHRQ